MFYIGLIAGFFISVIIYFVINLIILGLNKPESSPILNNIGALVQRKSIQKRKPIALTDLMAYQKEIQEEGENRG